MLQRVISIAKFMNTFGSYCYFNFIAQTLQYTHYCAVLLNGEVMKKSFLLAVIVVSASFSHAALAKDGVPAYDVLERFENRMDRRDNREDRRDTREDRRDSREDLRDEKYEGGRRDKLEDRRDSREDKRDVREDKFDRKENKRDRRENRRDRRN